MYDRQACDAVPKRRPPFDLFKCLLIAVIVAMFVDLWINRWQTDDIERRVLSLQYRLSKLERQMPTTAMSPASPATTRP